MFDRQSMTKLYRTPLESNDGDLSKNHIHVCVAETQEEALTLLSNFQQYHPNYQTSTHTPGQTQEVSLEGQQ